jgi:hypothetical protein
MNSFAFVLVAIGATGLNRALALTALVFAIVSYLRRKQEIGGWLLYFCYWIVGFLVISLADIVRHPQVFFHPVTQKSDFHLALILSVFPRLIAIIVAMSCMFVLLRTKEWVWVERLRLALMVAAIVAFISLAIDAKYFPRSLLANGARWIGLGLWTVYFLVSQRVRRVFQTHDWMAELQGVPSPARDSQSPLKDTTTTIGARGETK